MPLKEVRAGKHVVSPVTDLMRQDILHDHEVQCLQRFFHARGIGLTVKHRGARDKGRADGVGFACFNRFKNSGIGSGAFGIKHLIKRLFLGPGPGLSRGALAFAAGETHARRLKAPTLRDNEAAFFVEVTRKDIHNGKKRKVAGVVAVSGRVPAVVGHTAPGEELTRNAGDDGGGNPCDFRGFRGRPLVRHPLKGREHRFGI